MPFALAVFTIKAKVFNHFKTFVTDLNRLESFLFVIQQTLVVIFMNLVVDIVYKLIDPRITLTNKEG